MKQAIVLFLLFISYNSFSQSDTIFKMNGEILLVNVTEVNDETIKFIYPGESASNSIGISSVSKIHFKSGRKQEFSSALNVKLVKGCLDWDNVQISNIESEVKGLSKIDIIGAKAKGVTTMSSTGKLQDRAYKKLKIETAMLGGNVAYIIEQHTEEAIAGGQYAGSKAPSVTISGIAYTSKKVFPNEINCGAYSIGEIDMLETNAYEMEKVLFRPQTIDIKKEELVEENGFVKIKLTIKQVSEIDEYTIIYASKTELVLSGLSSSHTGKKTYYNVFLKKND